MEKDHPGIEFNSFAIDVINSFASHYYFLGDSIQAALELQFPIVDVAKKAAVSKHMKTVLHLLYQLDKYIPSQRWNMYWYGTGHYSER